MIANINDNNFSVSGRASALGQTNAISTERPVKRAEAHSAAVAVPDYNADVVSISNDGNIDLTLFNYLDKGGDASKALSEGVSSGEGFKPAPNFSGIGLTRYSQMKAEIERSFADNPGLKDKYLRELDKTLNDYLNLQAKLSEALSGRAGQESEEVSDEIESADKEELERLAAIFGSDSNGMSIIMRSVLGDNESNFPDELAKTVDEYFIDVYSQKMDVSKKVNAFNQEIKEDSRTKKIWESVRLQIDKDD